MNGYIYVESQSMAFVAKIAVFLCSAGSVHRQFLLLVKCPESCKILFVIADGTTLMRERTLGTVSCNYMTALSWALC